MLREAAGLLLTRALVTVSLSVSCASCGSCAGPEKAGDSGPGDDGSTPTGPHDPSSSQACLAYATAYCGRLQACTPFLLQVSYGDLNTCAQRTAKGCLPALSATSSQITPSQMEGCAAAIDSQSCDEALDNPQPSACDIPGTLPMGAACGASSQCQSGYCKQLGGMCGTCAMHLGVTAPCLADVDCSASLVCNLGVCVGPGVAGAPCGPTGPCMRTLACIAGKCQTPGAVGSPCSAPTECDGAHGAYCDMTAKVCAPTQVVSTGQPCGLVAGGVAACASGQSCGNLTPQGQGTCHPTAADGAPCGPDIACLSPAVCSPTARCTLPNPAVCH